MNNELLAEFCANIKHCNSDKINMVPAPFMHAVIGMADEMGEIMEVLKRALYYGDKIDNDNLIEEYGDILFYIMLDCMRIADEFNPEHDDDCTVDQVFWSIFKKNIAKLKARYPDGFSEAKATESGRDREAERQAMRKPLKSPPMSVHVYESLNAKLGIDKIGMTNGPKKEQTPKSSRSSIRDGG